MDSTKDLLMRAPAAVHDTPYRVRVEKGMLALVQSLERDFRLNIYREGEHQNGFRMHDMKRLDPELGRFEGSPTPHLMVAEWNKMEFEDIVASPRSAYLCEVAIEINEDDYIVSPMIQLDDTDFASKLSRQIRAVVICRGPYIAAYSSGSRRYRIYWWQMIEGIERS